jgi:hypothetical protein
VFAFEGIDFHVTLYQSLDTKKPRHPKDTSKPVVRVGEFELPAGSTTEHFVTKVSEAARLAVAATTDAHDTTVTAAASSSSSSSSSSPSASASSSSTAAATASGNEAPAASDAFQVDPRKIGFDRVRRKHRQKHFRFQHFKAKAEGLTEATAKQRCSEYMGPGKEVVVVLGPGATPVVKDVGLEPAEGKAPVPPSPPRGMR